MDQQSEHTFDGVSQFRPQPSYVRFVIPTKSEGGAAVKGGAASTAMREHAKHPQQCTTLLAPCLVCFEVLSTALQILKRISTQQRCIQRSFCAEIWSVYFAVAEQENNLLTTRGTPSYTMYTYRDRESGRELVQHI